jgi:hypothetical protein
MNPGTRIRREAASGLKTKAGKLPRHPPFSSTQTHYVPEGFGIQPDP